MFGIGDQELLIIIVLGFLLFGPDKLPGAGRMLGRALKQFREAQSSLTDVVRSEIVEPISKTQDSVSKKAAQSIGIEDLDDEDADEPIARRRETFAERKARLARERAAAERAAAKKVEATASAAEESEAPAASASEQAVKDEAPAQSSSAKSGKALRSAADLYGLSTEATKTSSATKSDSEAPGEEDGRA